MPVINVSATHGITWAPRGSRWWTSKHTDRTGHNIDSVDYFSVHRHACSIPATPHEKPIEQAGGNGLPPATPLELRARLVWYVA